MFRSARQNESTTVSPRLRRGVFRGVFRPGAVIALAATALAALALAGPRGAFGQCQYDVTAVIQYAPPNCPILITVARGMNEHGHVVGYFNHCLADLTFAFLWTPEAGLTALPTPEGVTFARAEDINDAGVIIGRHTFPGVGFKAFAWDPETEEYTYLEPLHEGVTGTPVSAANAINNDGLVAGSRLISKPGEAPVSNAVLWDTNTGEITDLGVIEGPNSVAKAINGIAQVAGDTGDLFQSQLQAWALLSGRIVVLGQVPGAFLTQAGAISVQADIAGGGAYADHPEGLTSQGAVWSAGEWNLLPLLSESTGGGALALNDVGQSGGRCVFAGSTERGVLWQHGNAIDLEAWLIDVPDQLHIERVRVLSNAGQILTRGKLGGKTVGVVLTPINVPPTDLNYDCTTDLHDLMTLLDQWGPVPDDLPPGVPTADFNGDGIVNVDDLLILLANWGP